MIQIETILDILVKGFVIGIVVSAPLGPVGVLCIQRTLNKGRWYGFVTGLGASLSDIAYALLTGYGMSFVFDYINKNNFLFCNSSEVSCYWLLVFIHSAAILCNPFGLYRPIKVLISTTSLPPLQLHFPIRLLFFFSSVLFARFAFVQPGVLVFEEITGYLAIASERWRGGLE